MWRWLCRLCGFVIESKTCSLNPTIVGYRCDSCGIADAWEAVHDQAVTT